MIEIAFVSAIVGTFTVVWLIIDGFAAMRWPATKNASPLTNFNYSETSSQAFSTNEVFE